MAGGSAVPESADPRLRRALRRPDRPGLGHDRDQPARVDLAPAVGRRRALRGRALRAARAARGGSSRCVDFRIDEESGGELQVRGPWIAASYYDDDTSAREVHRGRLAADRRRRRAAPRLLHPARRPHQGPRQVRRRVDLLGGARERDHGPPRRARGGGDRRPRREVERAAVRLRRAHATAAELDADGVRAFLEGRVAKWWLPERVEFIDEVPKTSVGKFDKKVLRAQFAERVTTLVVSDLHLGARTGIDLLRRAELREPLLEALEGVDRLVLLGDALELRHGPAREALAAARPLFEALGRARWREPPRSCSCPATTTTSSIGAVARAPRPRGARRAARARAAPSTRARGVAAGRGGWRVGGAGAGRGRLPGRVAARRRLRDARPLPRPPHHRSGLRAPRRRRSSSASCARCPIRWRPPRTTRRVLAPMYALLYGARPVRCPRRRARPHSGASVRAWEQLAGGGAPAPRCATRCSRRGLPARRSRRSTAPASGRCAPSSPAPALRRAGAARRWARSSAGSASTPRTCIFGHTHRSGPWPADDVADWRRRRGARLHNSGSWVYEPVFLDRRRRTTARTGRGRASVVEESGPPRLRRLLGERGHEELSGASPGVKHVAWQVTPSPTSSSSTRARCGARARPADSSPGRRRAISRPFDPHHAAPVEHRPHAAGLVGARVGAGLVGRLGAASSDAGRVLGAHGRERLALDAEQLLDRALGLLRRRPRRSGSRAGALRGPTGSGRASRGSRRAPRAPCARRRPPGRGSPRRSTAARTACGSREGSKPALCTPITRRPSPA